jgi:23S rRNA (adenine1618-N6)-methyltransferase
MHPRNLHKNGYPITSLCQAYPQLQTYVVNAKSGKQSIDFANPDAVKALNAALLIYYYGMDTWDIPQGYLCPPVPGRADYIHGIADLLAAHHCDGIPTGKQIKVLDIGTGANAIYPIIGSQTYGWQFVGSELDAKAVKSAQFLAHANKKLAPLFTVRQQRNKDDIFAGIIQPNEHFTVSLCNPPFHKSAADAAQGSQRKTSNLARNQQQRQGKHALSKTKSGQLNFAGMPRELWCDGGELAFIQRMITQSVEFKHQVCWFTCLVSKSAHLKAIETSIRYYGASQFYQIDMTQGQKKSRFIAWSYEQDNS